MFVTVHLVMWALGVLSALIPASYILFCSHNLVTFYMCVPVSTDIENKAAWKPCLSVQGVRLPTGYYFGMTAATGDLSDNHDIMSVRLYELDLPDDVSTLVLNAYTHYIKELHFIFTCLTVGVMWQRSRCEHYKTCEI
jgi:hypothetical protein